MSLPTNKQTYLGADFTIEGDTLKIIGTIDSASPSEFLTDFFKDLHNAIVKAGLGKINVDITSLSYLNSSSIKEIVTWIILQKSTPEDKAYTIHFICNSSYLWQDSSISTVSFLNPSKITKELI